MTDPLLALKREIKLFEGDRSSPVDLDVLYRAVLEIERLRAKNAELRETVLWCQRRLPPLLQPYVDRMLAGDYVRPGLPE
jgi:hypothetical protein